MKICDLTLPELDRFRALSNFTQDERLLFDVLADGNTMEQAAEICNISISTAKRTKRKIWTKIERIKSL